MIVAVLGASGYTGQVLVRLLSRHPAVDELLLVRQKKEKGSFQQLSPLDPDLAFVTEKEAEHADVFFLCLPDGESMARVPELLKKRKKVVDLSGDYRVSPKAYEKFYRAKHKDLASLRRSVYGLPELFARKIQKTDLVANPGCYATAAILALYPICREALIDAQSIIIDAKSGVSGAGRKPTLRTHFVEVNESIEPYRAVDHDQIPEIEEALTKACRHHLKISFTPHLLSQSQGILCSVYGRLIRKPPDLLSLYRQSYEKAPFVKVLDQLPKTKWVTASPYCLITPVLDQRSYMIKIFSVLDNLWKGAASQAIENFNLMHGFPQETGLDKSYPPKHGFSS